MRVKVTDEASEMLQQYNRQSWLIKYQTDDCG
ncbi:hypothetical protein Bsel_2321 [[Bacillus] selenitireducens MLS10]|uniref:Uncharacterized protein n=1 Tax=Bacillus selenitireducens (strain ATCC 700615 / DSM 15326 / MLS10) TaxID=439292 RepID=D6XW70_BACIE|nr:hypothetical protein Bsel_2321 [[Bacillus] selenitireducens MLS10]